MGLDQSLFLINEFLFHEFKKWFFFGLGLRSINWIQNAPELETYENVENIGCPLNLK